VPSVEVEPFKCPQLTHAIILTIVISRADFIVMQVQCRRPALIIPRNRLNLFLGLNCVRACGTLILGALAIIIVNVFWASTAHARETPNTSGVTSAPNALTAPQKSVIFDYALAPGDLISVEIFGEPDLSKDYTVGESGKIAFPLVGEVNVLSLKTKQVERLLRVKLKSGFLVNPRVTVTIRTYRSVYINGQVASPNGYPFVPGMTVRKLISIAGGFTERASKSRIYVISEVAGASTSPRKVKLDAEVRPGDIISVEESFF
jgi:protein involved in polysaccharide export with SLBB domain